MLFSVIFSFLAGSSIVLQRIVNAKLSEKCSTLATTLYNYIFGLAGAIVILFVMGRADISHFSDIKNIPWWMYLGGILGIGTIFVSAAVAPKISQLVMSLLMFVGQIFCSVCIDFMLDGTLNIPNIIGGICALAGLLLINLDTADRRK